MSIKHINFDDYGYKAFGSVTASYTTLLSLSDDADVLFIFNTLNQPILLQLPSKLERASSVGTKEVRLPASVSFSIDCRTNSKRVAKGDIKIKYASAAPTSGEITITAVR